MFFLFFLWPETYFVAGQRGRKHSVGRLNRVHRNHALLLAADSV